MRIVEMIDIVRRKVMRPIRLAKVLNITEQYRQNQKDIPEPVKVEVPPVVNFPAGNPPAGTVPVVPVMEDPAVTRARERREVINALKKYRNKLITLVIVLALMMLGMLRAIMGADTSRMADLFKYVYLIDVFVIFYQNFSKIRDKLYRDKNLLLLLAMPYTSMEIVMAKYYQVVGKALSVMAMTVLPLWFGYSVGAHFEKGFTLASFLAVVCIPVFVLCVIYMLVILLHTWMLTLIPKNPLASIGIPAMIGLVLLVGLIAIQVILKGNFLLEVLDALANVLAFNFALRWIIRGDFLWPFIFIVTGMVLALVLFEKAVSVLYRESLLHRWDLADDQNEQDADTSKILRARGVFRSLLQRELTTVFSSKCYSGNLTTSWILVPILMMILCGMFEAFVPAFSLEKSKSVVELIGCLFFMVVPFTCITGFINRAAGTPFSRDAKIASWLHMLPIDKDLLLGAKLISSFILCGLGSFPWLIMGGMALMAVGKLPLWTFFLGLLINLFTVVWVASSMVMQDLAKPNMDWNTQEEMTARKNHTLLLVQTIVSILAPIILRLVFHGQGRSWALYALFLLFLLLLFPVRSILMILTFGIKKVSGFGVIADK